MWETYVCILHVSTFHDDRDADSCAKPASSSSLRPCTTLDGDGAVSGPDESDLFEPNVTYNDSNVANMPLLALYKQDMARLAAVGSPALLLVPSRGAALSPFLAWPGSPVNAEALDHDDKCHQHLPRVRH